MLGFTRKTDYALIALLHLVERPDEVFSAREIADRFGGSVSLLMNVLKQLSSADVVASVRGARGGYTLARPAEEISLVAVIDVMEGPMRLAPCVGARRDSNHDNCDLEPNCPVCSPLRALQAKLNDVLENMTLAELAQSGRPVELAEKADT